MLFQDTDGGSISPRDRRNKGWDKKLRMLHSRTGFMEFEPSHNSFYSMHLAHILCRCCPTFLGLSNLHRHFFVFVTANDFIFASPTDYLAE